MMELHLIEKGFFARDWMLGNGLANLGNAEGCAAMCPFATHASLFAFRFHRSFVFSVEKTLPRHVNARGEIANIHQAFFLELVAHLGIQLLIYRAQIHDRSATTLARCLHAKKVDLCRPAVQVRTLCVIQDRFVIGIGRGCVNLPRYTFPGQVAILRVKLLAESSGYLFEVCRGF